MRTVVGIGSMVINSRVDFVLGRLYRGTEVSTGTGGRFTRRTLGVRIL